MTPGLSLPNGTTVPGRVEVAFSGQLAAPFGFILYGWSGKLSVRHYQRIAADSRSRPTVDSSEACRPSAIKLEQPSVKTAKDFPVVCVGGSAGGLDAYTRLLRHLPADMKGGY